jgi:hypothetical protein
MTNGWHRGAKAKKKGKKLASKSGSRKKMSGKRKSSKKK